MSNDYSSDRFENPSRLWVLEDGLKVILGGPLLYNPYFKTFGLKGNEHVLDFGCGGGNGSMRLAKLLNRGGSLTCVDTSNFWMKKARKRLRKYPNTVCLKGDIRQLDIADGSFDVTCIIHVIHDIPPDERQAIIRTIGQKMKPGGRLFIREPIKEPHGMPADDIRALFADSGFREVEGNTVKSEYLGKYCLDK
jgi:ubiquinone/menaquinone biosynthesis C-methylase UbiE